ncbi:expressed unknown protein [Ectocarpus siliculosus]|uniref:Uncharacterized protein n=1 Tax=Ectocarpus siliculosus TaxID=2880 RepID=D8LDH5_ECTSI|nr:expressed unknown protein [Ectocarpus siliculosus]|eukprot:CBN74040.1 expressed unknown protein [Ectocarpus siliculosus]
MSASGGGSYNMEAAAKEQALRDELVQRQGKLGAARAEVEDTNKTRVTLSGEYADASGVLRRAMKELDFTRKQIYDEQTERKSLLHVKKRNLERAVKKLEDTLEERRVWTEAWERRLEDLRQAVTVAGEAALEVAKENLDIAKAGLCGDHNTQEPDKVRDMLSPVVQDSVLSEMDRIQEIAKKADNASCTLEEAVHSLAEATEDGEIQRQQGEKHRELLDTERKKLKKVEKEWRKTMEDFEFLQGKEAQAKESLNAAKSVAAAKQNELKETIKAHNNAKSLVAEVREAEANIARQLRDCAEFPMHAASRERLVAEFADWERAQEEEDSARDEEQRLEEELDYDDEQPQMCHNLEAVQDAWNDETTHEFGAVAGYPDNTTESAATRQAEVESEPSRNNGKVSSNHDKDRPRRYRWVGGQEQGQEEASSEDDRPRRRYQPDEQQEEEEEEEEEEEDRDNDAEYRIPLARRGRCSSHVANVQRRSSKGKGPLGKSRMAVSSQATRVLGGAQQRQARTVDHQTVATGNSKGKGKARGGANTLRQDHAASSAYEWRMNKGVPRTGLFGGVRKPRKVFFSGTTETNNWLGIKRKTPSPSQVAGEEGTGRLHHGNRQQEGGRAGDQNIPKKRVRSAGQKITPGRFIEGGERAPPRFAVKFPRRSSSSPSVNRDPEAVAETSTNAQTGASSESNAVATTTTEATMSTGEAKESPNTDSTSETPAALARVELSCKTEPAMSEGSSASS